MTTNRTFKHLIACAALLCATAAAGASEFWTYVPGSGNLKVDNASGGAGFASVSVTGYNGVGGQFNGNFWNGAATAPVDSLFRFFCIDLLQHANTGPNTYASSVVNDDMVQKLYDVAYPNKQLGDFWNSGPTNFGLFGDATSAAAFQVALWNIYFDHDLSLGAGTFQWVGGSTTVSQAAQNLLNQVGSYSGDGYQRWTLYRFTSERYQDYLSATYRVPEPATFSLMLMALAALACTVRRRQRA